MEESIKHVKVRLIEGVEGDRKSVDGDEYLISTFLKVYEEIKTMGHDLMYRFISTLAKNPDIDMTKLDYSIQMGEVKPDIDYMMKKSWKCFDRFYIFESLTSLCGS